MGRTVEVLSKSKVVRRVILIFVTVGTHEQQFDRVVKEIDELKKNGVIKEDVFIQTGYCTYKPACCEYKDVISYDEMDHYTKKARIVITHGGPGSIFQAIQYGKKPIVVPRNPEFDEHVDDHQIKFTKRMHNNGRIDLVLDINDLKEKIINYEGYQNNENNNNDNVNKFIREFDNIVLRLFNGGL